MGVLDTINAATVARNAVTLCLDTAIYAEHEKLQTQLSEVAPHDNFDRSKSRPIVEAMEALREKAKASEVRFTFEGLSWTGRMELEAEHPPRADDKADQDRGFNRVTLVPALIRASVIEVEEVATGDTATVIPDEYWRHLLGGEDKNGKKVTGVLNRQQVIDLYTGAVAVNDISPTVPQSALALLNPQATGESSKSPEPGPSHLDGSKGGSRPTSRKSNATKKAVSPGSPRKPRSPSGTSTPAT
jgi:hypothetical protein